MNEHIIREFSDTSRGIPDTGESPPTQEEIFEAQDRLRSEIRKQPIMIFSGPCRLVRETLGELDYVYLDIGDTWTGQALAYDMGVM